MDPLAADDLQMLVTKLARRLELAERKLVPVLDVVDGSMEPPAGGRQ